MPKRASRWVKQQRTSQERSSSLLNIGVPAITGLLGASLGVLGSLGATAIGASAQSQNSRDDFLRTQQQAVFVDVIRTTHSFETTYDQVQKALGRNRDATVSKYEATMIKLQDTLANADGDQLALLAPHKVISAELALQQAVSDAFAIFSVDGLDPVASQNEINGRNALRAAVQSRLSDFEHAARAAIGAHD